MQDSGYLSQLSDYQGNRVRSDLDPYCSTQFGPDGGLIHAKPTANLDDFRDRHISLLALSQGFLM